MLAELAVRPQLDLAVSDEIDETLPEVAGGLSLALGRTFRIIDPGRATRRPSSGSVPSRSSISCSDH